MTVLVAIMGMECSDIPSLRHPFPLQVINILRTHDKKDDAAVAAVFASASMRHFSAPMDVTKPRMTLTTFDVKSLRTQLVEGVESYDPHAPSQMEDHIAAAVDDLEKDMTTSNSEMEGREDALAVRYLDLEAGAADMPLEQYEDELFLLEGERKDLELERAHLQVGRILAWARMFFASQHITPLCDQSDRLSIHTHSN